MKLHILSDLHLEFSPFSMPKVEADVLVLAGDIGNGLQGLEFASKQVDNYELVIYVPGNHEYYNHNITHLSNQMKEYAKEGGVVLLDNAHHIHEDVVFIGSTLWTDFRLYGNELGKIGYFMNQAKNNIYDFNCIRYAHMWFSASHCAQISLTSQGYIEEKMKEYNSYKKVVVSHHAPSMKSVHEKYLGNKLNPCFANNLDYLVSDSDLWIHGHVHDSFDYIIGNSRVLANPRGYAQKDLPSSQENKMFNSELVISI